MTPREYIAQNNIASLPPTERFQHLSEIGNLVLDLNGVDFAALPDEEQQAVSEEIKAGMRENYPELFTVTVKPEQPGYVELANGQRLIGEKADQFLKAKRGQQAGFGYKKVDTVPAVQRPLYDPETEQLIAGIQEGVIEPSDVPDRQTLEQLIPLVRQAAPEKTQLFVQPILLDLSDRGIGPDSFLAKSTIRGMVPGAIERGADSLAETLNIDNPQQAEDYRQWQIVYGDIDQAFRGIGAVAGSALASGGTATLAKGVFQKAGTKLVGTLVGEGLVGAAYAEQLPALTAEVANVQDPTARKALAGLESVAFASAIGLPLAFAKQIKGKTVLEAIKLAESQGIKDVRAKLGVQAITPQESQAIALDTTVRKPATLSAEELEKKIKAELKPTPPKKPLVVEGGSETRETFLNQKKDQVFTKDVSDKIEATGITKYEPISNVASFEEAQKIVQKQGRDRTKAMLLDRKQDLNLRQRTVLFNTVIEDLSKSYEGLVSQGKTVEATRTLDELIEFENANLKFRTEVAQALQLGNQKTDLIPAVWIRKYEHAINEAVKSGEKIQFQQSVARELDRRVRKLKDVPEGFQRQEAINEIYRYLSQHIPPSKGDLTQAILYGNMLSGPQTQLVNIQSTFLQSLSDAVTFAAVKPSRVSDIAVGMFNGMAKGFREAGGILATGVGRKGDFAKVGRIPDVLERHVFRGLMKPLNAYKYVPRFMQASDMVFFKGAQEFQSRVLAHELAQKEGLKGKALLRRKAEILGNRAEDVQKFRLQATAEGLTGNRHARRVNELMEMARPAEVSGEAIERALKSTFNNEPEGMIGALAKSINRFTQKYPVGKLVVPFTNIVANVTNRYIDYSPLGYARMLAQYAGKTGYEVGSDLWKQQLAQATLGTFAMVAMATKNAQHIDEADPEFSISGRGTGDFNRNNQLQESGWRPYSIKLGNTYFDYRTTPLAISASIIGNYTDAIKFRSLNEESAQDRAAYALSQVPRVIIDQSFLTGVRDLFAELGRDPVNPSKGLFERAATTARNLAIPNLIKQVDRIFDPTVYTDDDIKEFLIRDIPVARSMEGYPILNALGEPIRQGYSLKERTLSRFVSEEKTDPVWRMISQNQAFLPDYRDSAKLKEVSPETGMLIEREMTPNEYYNYVYLRGKYTREMLDPVVTVIRDQPKEIIQNIVAKISRSAGERAKVEVQQVGQDQDKIIVPKAEK